MKQMIVKYWKEMSIEDTLFIFSMFGFALSFSLIPQHYI